MNDDERCRSIPIGRCAWCGRLFQIKRRTLYCSSRCRRKYLEAYDTEPSPLIARIELDRDMHVTGSTTLGYRRQRRRNTPTRP